MSILTRFRRRLQGMIRPDVVYTEVADELAFHLERRADEYVRAGMPATEARRAAERSFGPVADIQEEGYALRGGTAILKQPSAFLPVLMSIAAIGVVALHVVRYGAAREADEGSSAHIWQLLIGLQLPMIAWFILTWLPRAPRQAALVLALQAIALLAALAPVLLLGF